jgi:hypothetical protein
MADGYGHSARVAVERLTLIRTGPARAPRDDEAVTRHRRPESLIEREDVDAILAALYDIRAELAAIRALLEEETDGEEEAEEEAPS